MIGKSVLIGGYGLLIGALVFIAHIVLRSIITSGAYGFAGAT